MEVKTIKNIDDDTWASFKGLAAKNKLKAGQMFKVMVNEYAKKSSGFWNKVLNHKPILTAKEANQLERATSEMRKEKGWRI